MHRRIAAALLEALLFRVCAVISLDENGKIVDAVLLSTDWPQGRMRIAEGAKEVWLISNHPDGNILADEQDRHNHGLLVHMAGNVRVRFFLASEYFPCFEAEIPKGQKI